MMDDIREIGKFWIGEQKLEELKKFKDVAMFASKSPPEKDELCTKRILISEIIEEKECCKRWKKKISGEYDLIARSRTCHPSRGKREQCYHPEIIIDRASIKLCPECGKGL